MLLPSQVRVRDSVGKEGDKGADRAARGRGARDSVPVSDRGYPPVGNAKVLHRDKPLRKDNPLLHPLRLRKVVKPPKGKKHRNPPCSSHHRRSPGML